MAVNCPQARNTPAANYSAILGGCGNTDSGYAYTGMFGCGLVASASPSTMGVPSAMWVDHLISSCIPVITSATSPIFIGLPSGALYTTGAVGAGFTNRPVFVK